MKKILIIAAVIVLLTIIGGGIFFLAHTNSNPSTTTSASAGAGNNGISTVASGTPPALAVPSGDTIQIGTAQGVVTVNNFYKQVVSSEDEFLVLYQSDNYQITYDTTQSSFYINILASSTNENLRDAGEASFLSILGINKSDACKLDVHEGFLDSPTVAADQPTLSFCNFSTSVQ